MYRIITWFNSLKVRFKSKRFIIPIIFALAFLFFPKYAFALEVDNVKFYNNNQLVYTFTKTDIQNGFIATDQPVEVDAFHINYKDANLKTNYVYDFEANFNLGGNRVYNEIVDYFVYASPEGSTSNLLTSTDSWFLYSVEYNAPVYVSENVVNSSFTSTVSSNNLRFQYDLGYSMFLYSFRLNSAKLTNDGQDVGDVISNQTQELLENQNKNQQQTNERLDELKKQITTCRNSYNIFDGIIEVGRYDFSTGSKIVNDNNIRNKNFIPVNSNTDYIISNNGNGVAMNVFFYDENKRYLYYETVNAGSFFKTSSNTKFINFFRGSSDTDMLQIQRGLTITPFEAYGKEVCTSKLDETNDKLDNLDKTLNDDNVSGATSTGNDFFDNFTLDDNGGISSIVTLPLRVIRGLISGENNCSALNFDILGTSVYFPGGCIMWDHVSSVNETLFQTIICGFFGYILLTKLFKDIEDLKNPNKEEVSTIDL